MPWTVWAVEDDLDTSVPEIFDIASYASFDVALAAARAEIEENGAVICAYVTSEASDNIWFVVDGLTRKGAPLAPGITGWREALASI